MSVAVSADAVTHGAFSLPAVLAGIALLVLNGVFVAVEIALLAAHRAGIEESAEAGDPRGRRALKALTELSVTFSGAQLGITMCSLGLGMIAEPAVASLFAGWLGTSPLPEGVVPLLAFVLSLSLVVFLHLVIGEMAPKNLALARAQAVALRLARPFGWYVAVVRPLVLVLNGVARLLVRLVRVEPVDEHKLVHSPDELALALTEARDMGTIAPQDARVMGAALRLQRIEAEAAMTPRVDLSALPDTASADEVLELAAETGYTRLPVYHEDIDHVVGLVHVKDVLMREHLDGLEVSQLLRPIPAVPESRDLEQLLRDMLDSRAHAVLVVDEFGGTAGVLSLEDVLEQLVGEIEDEFDAERGAQSIEERVWVVPGMMRREEAERLTGARLPPGDAETVSGSIVESLGRLVELGDEVRTEDGWRLSVRSLDGRRAGDVEIRAPEELAEGIRDDE